MLTREGPGRYNGGMRLSYSSLDTYQSCPLKYKYREIDKIPEPKSKEAVFGTLVHSVMKFIHAPGLIHPTLEQALDYFGKHWNSAVFENKEIEERAAFSQGVQMIQKYYAAHQPADFTIVDLESRFSITIGSEAAGIHTVSGIIDRIDKTETGYEIIDYKTSRKLPSQEKIDTDLQLSIYLRAFLERYPKEKEHLESITVSLYFLQHGVKLSSKRTAADLAALDTLFLDVIAKIENEEFDPILSPLCDWCSYQKICPLWKHKFREERTLDTAAVQQAIRDYIETKRTLGEQKLRLAQLQETILAYMDQEGVERVFGESGIIGKTRRITQAFDDAAVRDVLVPLGLWDEVLAFDPAALKKLLPTLPRSAQEKIAESITTKESISLSVRKGDSAELSEV